MNHGSPAAEVVWPYGVEGDGSWHSTDCKCDRHCPNCYATIGASRRRYCSDQCARRWRREVALDEVLSGTPPRNT